MQKTPADLVRERDDNTCQNCGKKWHPGLPIFYAHHIDPKMEGDIGESKTKWDLAHLDRLITICPPCHKIVRRKVATPAKIMIRVEAKLYKRLKIYAYSNSRSAQDCLDDAIRRFLK